MLSPDGRRQRAAGCSSRLAQMRWRLSTGTAAVAAEPLRVTPYWPARGGNAPRYGRRKAGALQCANTAVGTVSTAALATGTPGAANAGADGAGAAFAQKLHPLPRHSVHARFGAIAGVSAGAAGWPQLPQNCQWGLVRCACGNSTDGRRVRRPHCPPALRREGTRRQHKRTYLLRLRSANSTVVTAVTRLS